MRGKSYVSFFVVVTLAFGQEVTDPDQEVTSTVIIDDNVDADDDDDVGSTDPQDPSAAQSSFYTNSMNSYDTKSVSCDNMTKKEHAGIVCPLQVSGYVQRLAEIIAKSDTFQARAFQNRLIEDRKRAIELRGRIVTSQNLLAEQTQRTIKIADGLEVQGLCIDKVTHFNTLADQEARKDGIEQNVQRLHNHMTREERLWNQTGAESLSLGQALAAADKHQRALAGENTDFGKASGTLSSQKKALEDYTFEDIFPKIAADGKVIEEKEGPIVMKDEEESEEER